MELQPQSVVAGSAPWQNVLSVVRKSWIRLLAFTDAAGVLHMIGAGPMPCDSS